MSTSLSPPPPPFYKSGIYTYGIKGFLLIHWVLVFALFADVAV